jgi:hypothetical protein
VDVVADLHSAISSMTLPVIREIVSLLTLTT